MNKNLIIDIASKKLTLNFLILKKKIIHCLFPPNKNHPTIWKIYFVNLKTNKVLLHHLHGK